MCIYMYVICTCVCVYNASWPRGIYPRNVRWCDIRTSASPAHHPPYWHITKEKPYDDLNRCRKSIWRSPGSVSDQNFWWVLIQALLQPDQEMPDVLLDHESSFVPTRWSVLTRNRTTSSRNDNSAKWRKDTQNTVQWTLTLELSSEDSPRPRRRHYWILWNVSWRNSSSLCSQFLWIHGLFIKLSGYALWVYLSLPSGTLMDILYIETTHKTRNRWSLGRYWVHYIL